MTKRIKFADEIKVANHPTFRQREHSGLWGEGAVSAEEGGRREGQREREPQKIKVMWQDEDLTVTGEGPRAQERGLLPGVEKVSRRNAALLTP